MLRNHKGKAVQKHGKKKPINAAVNYYKEKARDNGFAIDALKELGIPEDSAKKIVLLALDAPQLGSTESDMVREIFRGKKKAQDIVALKTEMIRWRKQFLELTAEIQTLKDLVPDPKLVSDKLIELLLKCGSKKDPRYDNLDFGDYEEESSDQLDLNIEFTDKEKTVEASSQSTEETEVINPPRIEIQENIYEDVEYALLPYLGGYELGKVFKELYEANDSLQPVIEHLEILSSLFQEIEKRIPSQELRERLYHDYIYDRPAHRLSYKDTRLKNMEMSKNVLTRDLRIYEAVREISGEDFDENSVANIRSKIHKLESLSKEQEKLVCLMDNFSFLPLDDLLNRIPESIWMDEKKLKILRETLYSVHEDNRIDVLDILVENFEIVSPLKFLRSSNSKLNSEIFDILIEDGNREFQYNDSKIVLRDTIALFKEPKFVFNLGVWLSNYTELENLEIAKQSLEVLTVNPIAYHAFNLILKNSSKLDSEKANNIINLAKYCNESDLRTVCSLLDYNITQNITLVDNVTSPQEIPRLIKSLRNAKQNIASVAKSSSKNGVPWKKDIVQKLEKTYPELSKLLDENLDLVDFHTRSSMKVILEYGPLVAEALAPIFLEQAPGILVKYCNSHRVELREICDYLSKFKASEDINGIVQRLASLQRPDEINPAINTWRIDFNSGNDISANLEEAIQEKKLMYSNVIVLGGFWSQERNRSLTEKLSSEGIVVKIYSIWEKKILRGQQPDGTIVIAMTTANSHSGQYGTIAAKAYCRTLNIPFFYIEQNGVDSMFEFAKARCYV